MKIVWWYVSYRRFPSSQHTGSKEAAAEHRRTSLRRLEISAAGYGVVRSVDELPPNFLAYGVSQEIKGKIYEMPQTGHALLCVSERLHASEENALVSGVRLDSVKVGEITIQRNVKHWLLRELQEDLAEAPYRAAGDSELHVNVNGATKTLEVSGIIYHDIDLCHEGLLGTSKSTCGTQLPEVHGTSRPVQCPRYGARRRDQALPRGRQTDGIILESISCRPDLGPE